MAMSEGVGDRHTLRVNVCVVALLKKGKMHRNGHTRGIFVNWIKTLSSSSPSAATWTTTMTLLPWPPRPPPSFSRWPGAAAGGLRTRPCP